MFIECNYKEMVNSKHIVYAEEKVYGSDIRNNLMHQVEIIDVGGHKHIYEGSYEELKMKLMEENT